MLQRTVIETAACAPHAMPCLFASVHMHHVLNLLVRLAPLQDEAAAGRSADEAGGSADDEEDAEAAEQAGTDRRRSTSEAKVREEEDAMKDVMMSRKNRKLYERIKRAQSGKRERVEVLEKRKAKIGDVGGVPEVAAPSTRSASKRRKA
jgi:hypothetical protein